MRLKLTRIYAGSQVNINCYTDKKCFLVLRNDVFGLLCKRVLSRTLKTQEFSVGNLSAHFSNSITTFLVKMLQSSGKTDLFTMVQASNFIISFTPKTVPFKPWQVKCRGSPKFPAANLIKVRTLGYKHLQVRFDQ